MITEEFLWQLLIDQRTQGAGFTFGFILIYIAIKGFSPAIVAIATGKARKNKRADSNLITEKEVDEKIGKCRSITRQLHESFANAVERQIKKQDASDQAIMGINGSIEEINVKFAYGNDKFEAIEEHMKDSNMFMREIMLNYKKGQ